MTINFIPLIFAASTTVFVALNYKRLLHSKVADEHKPLKKRPQRWELPLTLCDWRDLFDLDDDTINPVKEKWYLLKDFFEEQYGVLLWDNHNTTLHRPPPADTRLPKPNGYNTLSHCNTDKCISRWAAWGPYNGAQHSARTVAGCDVIVRVMSSGGTGENYRDIMRHLNQAPDILLSTNHVLPMLVEMVYEDISFGVFPKLDAPLLHAFTSFYSNSVEDVLYMIIEALEGISYLHEHRVAHQDLFLLNFVIQWQPESLIKRATVRPRVWIIDFEDSVLFSEDTPPHNMKVAKFPRVLDECARPLAPEVYRSEPYCPFKLDVWQFGKDLEPFESGFDEVTQIFQEMSKDAPEERLTAAEALHRLDNFVRNQPPISLHTPFEGWV
ncbi:hypothetical protein BJ165DRAFT_1610538 [Panaeolus papilionaceus]|nr:hypothetical protein BJ165DRAFT_1610538 [Panaeolus papilionaceus]